METLVFKNSDASGDMRRITIECSKASVEPILAWYGAYFAGDDYTVTMNGRKVPVDQNGELEPITIDA